MKRISLNPGRRIRPLVVLVSLLAALGARAAGPFTVNTTSDTHATAPASSANDATAHISLRSAIEAANAQAGATTISVPAGTYPLSLGELSVAPNGIKTITITGAATTIVSQTDPTNRVFNIDFNSGGSTFVVISGITIQGGHDGADTDGGAGILDGSAGVTPKDALTVSNCVVYNNHCTTSSSGQIGGGIEMFGGDLTVVDCSFTNNSSGKSLGGGICFFSQTVISSLTVSNTVFAGNTVTNNSGAGPDGAGAIMISSPAGSTHSISASTFINNKVYGISGNTYGGAIQMNANGSTLNIVNSTFLSNSVSGSGGLGGAIYVDSGTNNMSFCRLVGNTASVGGSGLYNHSSNLAVTTATNNWWGCNGGPGATGCDVAAADGANLNFTPWLIITNTASPATINIGTSTALTASVLKNSSGQPITAAQVPVLIGLTLTWSAGAHGSLSGTQASIQANGQATATFQNDNTCNNGQPSVTLDNGTSIATVNVQCADLTVTKTNNVSGTVALGNSWNWTVHVANSGVVAAPFANGNTVALDNLPNTSIIYGLPSILNASGVTGTLVPAIDVNSNLTITASGAVTINSGGSFDIQLTVTPAVTGTYVNPRNTGLCVVDPNNNVSESNEANNGATNSVVVTCPVITGTVGGGGTICPGNSSLVTVTVTGGTPPYSVTLDSSGGTQAGSSPLLFSVSPGATTIYHVSSGTDAHGCSVTGSGSATVTVSPASAAITLVPASVLANSSGNLALGPNGLSSYAWTISNGTIIGPTNQATVTYVAGISNNVVLNLTAISGSGCSASSSAQAPVITGFSVHTNVTFTDALPGTTMTMAFDGTNYLSCSGGSAFMVARYGLNGALITTYSPGLDFRSLTTRPDGTVLARTYNSGVIYQQTTPGVFVSSGVTLIGGLLNPQSAVVLNGTASEFLAMSNNVVSRWSTNGTYLGAVNLAGFGTIVNETGNYQNRGLAVMGNFWLTYNGTNTLSIWSTNGDRVAQLTLPGSGTNFDSAYSFSYCNGKVFIVDIAGGKWRAFDLYGGASVAVLSAEPSASWNTDVVNKIAAVGFMPKVDLIDVTGSPIPTLAKLRSYQSVMVYSDGGFSDASAMGNVLADYLDQGGGMVMQVFSVVTNVAGAYGIQGRLSTNGYMPFTAAGYASATPLTMVKDLPAHPLLDGVTSFDGGTLSFHGKPMSTNSGATTVAHWTDGQAFAGVKDDGVGHSATLNFFPPSGDVFANNWVSSTDGARLMVNGLVWSGKIPPNIIAAPADLALPIGATATFKVIAAGASTLGYQWRLNGTNLPAATSSTLSFTVQAGSMGAYSVVVSNLYGATTSLNATLVPQLRFLTPIVSNKTFSLFLVDVDGSPVATNRAARVSIYATTNLSLPFAQWPQATNLVVPSGTQLRSDGFNTTNSASRFFRGVEAP
jgi:hypothetical protein